MTKPCNDFAVSICRLEQHAFAYRMNGLATVMRDGDETTGPEPLWQLEQLTEAERSFLGCKFDDALARLSRRGADEPGLRARVYAHVLESFGIACPHPNYWRRHFSADMFECQACEQLTVQALPKRRGA